MATRTTRLRSAPVHQFIKYMGSKASILDFVVEGIAEVHDGRPVCDLFAGSAILSAALGRQATVLSNDIQAYSRPLAGVYLTAWKDDDLPGGESMADEAARIVADQGSRLPDGLAYPERPRDLAAYNEIEARNRALIDSDLDLGFFVRHYSGTWWSAEQCLWIDALRQVAERHRDRPHGDLVLAALMHAMAYASQGTGHFAQYRDAKTASSMADIMRYRNRSVRDYFVRRFDDHAARLPDRPSDLAHEITALDYVDRLRTLPRSTVYADPPYCFVHYSRFYHALETIVLDDDPEIQVQRGQVVKGRYREGRHQSPFCIRSQVPAAFAALFDGVAASGSHLVLSYSNTGMLSLDDLADLARASLGSSHEIRTVSSAHRHMTMGRRQDRDRAVQEWLLIARSRD